jgi:hypothetical protein
MDLNKYPAMSLREVLSYEADAERLGVSEVARSSRGFLTQYKKAKTFNNLDDMWKIKRNAFIARHLSKALKDNENIKDYRNNRRALALIMWAYKP